MKVLYSAFVLFLFALGASGQALSDRATKPGVIVIQQKWRMEVRNPALEKDPLKANKDRQQEEIQQKADARENENRIRQGLPALPPRVRASAPETGARGITVAYIYEVKVLNTGTKKIRALTWDYVFFEPGTETEVGRRRFESRVSISPGQTKTLVMRSASFPTGTIDATKAGKKTRDMYSERVIIQRVEYMDGSVWHSTSN